jgi:hypothetical protein
MIPVTYGATFNLDEAMKPFEDLYNLQTNEPEWYWWQRTSILHRMQDDLEDDLDKCDTRVDKVVLDHMNWVSVSFTTEDTSLIRFEAEELERKIQSCIDRMVAEYPSRLKRFHDDLLHDGEEIPVDVYQP